LSDVVFWLPAINPYWHERFKALASDGRVSFECWFNSHVDPARSWVVDESDMTYPHIFLPQNSLRRARALAREYWRSRPRRIFTFHFEPRLWPVWLHRVAGGHVALYCLMTWDSWVSRSKPKELAKKIFFSIASSTLTPGPDSDKWARGYGAKNIHRLHHAIDDVALARAAALRRPSPVLRFLYIGRLVPEKGIGFLQDAVDQLLASGELRFELTIVGDGRLYQQLESWAAGTKGVVDVSPFVQASEVPSVYARTDVLLFPTLGDPYGLVVDEALAAGMPVVSSDKAGDIAWRLADGRGWVLPAEAPDQWSSRIQALIGDPEQVAAGGRAALQWSAGHNVNRWVEEIVQWINLTATMREHRGGWSRSRAKGGQPG
jgi:glycosyltransferase involved in cell wall biosynthesis